MKLYRLKLRPRSPWRTPWQADTLTGFLCAICARTRGEKVLRQRLIEPMLAGDPPFILSDACPGDLLPVPVHVRLMDWPPDRRKIVNQGRWMPHDAFELARRARQPPSGALHPINAVLLNHTRQHNTLGRLTDATLEDQSGGGGLFNRPETILNTPASALDGADYLSVYFRVRSDTADLLLELFEHLADSGFGADAATGRGRFELPENPSPMPILDQPPPDADGVIALSTFQPGSDDPTEGFWDAFTKFGKVSPGFGLTNEQTHKNPLILFRPGACFIADESRPPWLGRAIPMNEILPPSPAHQLRRKEINLIHPAFALTLPTQIKKLTRHE